MAKYGDLTTDKKGNISIKSKTEKQLAQEAASVISPIYAKQKEAMAAAQRANAASMAALRAGRENLYNVSSDTLKAAGTEEAARQQADAAGRGITMNRANMQNLTGAAQTKALTDTQAAKRQELDNIRRQISLAQGQYNEAMRNADVSKAAQLLTYKNQLMARRQDLFTQLNQFNYAMAHQKSGRSGGRSGGTGTGNPWQEVLESTIKNSKEYQSAANEINRIANTINDLVERGIITEKQALEQGKKYDKFGLLG